MKLRTHTIPLPTDYVSELRNQGSRKKSRCFIEYFYDMEVGEHNSYGFYAKSWEVGKATAHRWIKEFNEALEIFDAARELKRKTHYKKAVENNSVSLCPKNNGTNGTILTERLEINQDTKILSVEDIDGTNGTNVVEQSFININNNKNAFLDKDFYRFISEIKLSVKNVGNINDIYQSYLKIKEQIDLNTLSKVYREYSNETKSDRKVGLSKFIDDLMYLSYCKPYIVVNVDESYIHGCYDKEKELLITQDKNYGLTMDRYSELNADNKIKIIKYVA